VEAAGRIVGGKGTGKGHQSIFDSSILRGAVGGISHDISFSFPGFPLIYLSVGYTGFLEVAGSSHIVLLHRFLFV